MMTTKVLAAKVFSNCDAIRDIKIAFVKSNCFSFKNSARKVIEVKALENKVNMKVIKARINYGLN